MAAMLYLRGLNHTQHFLIATYLSGAGVFSDNVFVFVEDEDVVACFIRQQEQKDNPHKVSDHLLEYFVSFKEILQSLPWLEEQFGSVVRNIEVIHYTDCKMNARHSVSHPDHILDTGGLILNLNSSEYPLEFFDELEMYDTFLRKFSTLDEEGDRLQFIEDILPEIYSKEMRRKLENLKSNPTKEDALKLSLEIDGLINKKKFKTFLSKFKVFHSQANCKEMESVARDEFVKVVGGNREFMKDMDNIFDEFMRAIGEWMKENNVFLCEDSKLWRNVMLKVANMLSETKIKEVSGWGVHFTEESLEDLRNCLEENSVVSVLSDSEDASLSVLKVHQALQNETHILVDMEKLLDHPCEVFRTWESAWCTVLVVQSKKVNISEVSLICSEILRILQISDSHKLVLIAPRGDDVARSCVQEIGTECWEHVDTTTLADLSPQSQSSLLSKQVEFQGVLTTLATVLHPYPELLERIRGNLLTHLLSSTSPLIIGHAIPPVIGDYLPRTLSRSTKLSRKIFDHVSENTVIAISGCSPEELKDLLPYGEEPGQFHHIMDKESILCDSSFLTVKDSVEEDILRDITDEEFIDLHCLQVSRDNIEWKWSKGDTRYLKEYLIPSKTKYVKCELANDITEKVVLVKGEPGVGKTTFIHALARQTKEAYPSTWIAIIDLTVWGDYISNTLFEAQDKVITFLENLIGITESRTATLDKLIFTQSLYKCGNIVIFVDGFEHVPSYLIDKIAFLLKLLQENKIEEMYITCGPDIVEELQENVFTLPYTLMPLNSDDQKRFLISKWSKKLQDIDGLGTFVNEVLLILEDSISQVEMELTNLPLLTLMVGETFQEELNTYITTGVITLSSHFNLIRLYDKFVEKMCLMLLKTKRKSFVLDQHMLIENKLSLCDKYKTISLMSILSTEDYGSLDLNSLHYRYNRDIVDMKSVSVYDGSLINTTNGVPTFRYPTIREYFAAGRLAEEFIAMREFLQYHFLTTKFSVLRAWFDRILCKDSELHMAVLNGNTGKMNTLFANGVDVNRADNGGRTPLHLAAMYDMVDSVKALIRQGADVGISDNILKWTALRYADQIGAWGAIDMLIGSKYSSSDLICTMQTMETESLLNKTLSLACEKGYVSLIDFLYSHSADVRQVIDFEGSIALHLASLSGNTDLVQYLVRYEAEITKYGRQCRNILHYFNMNCFSLSGHLLQNSTANLNVSTNDGSTPLILAASKGHTDTIVALINLGADVNISRVDGASALHLAAENGHHHTVKYLIKYGANVNKGDNEGSSPLILAAKSGYTKIIFTLLQNGADANSIDNEGYSSLHWSAKGGYVESLHWLIKAGVDVDMKNKEECTALHLAAEEGHDDCAKCLIEAGADAEAINSDDATAVHLAAKNNSVHTLICLSANGANINVKNNENATALHWACHKGNKAAVKCLLELGAQTDAINTMGYSPLHIAVLGGHAGAVKCLIESGVKVEGDFCKHSPVLHIASRRGHTEVLRYLIDAGGDVNMPDKTGSTPLHWAAWGGHGETVDLLLRSGANTSLLDNNGSLPLHWAAGEGRTEAVRVLVEAGATVDLPNRDGDTPLHWAAKEGHVEAARVMIEAGTDVNKINAEGSTPIQVAMMGQHVDMIEYLSKYSTDS
ncbi:uncharacterized protein [Anabrus simplex]|uniref:uncharacterized protein n=1 Tax=Anabrus simplex TaxID=316456 RepID=UPI0035A30309